MTRITHEDTALEQCARICHECEDACLKLIPHCLDLGNAHAGTEHINMLIDCAAICGTSHNFLHRASLMHQSTCLACAEICQVCADDCERIAGDDQMMRDCAELCRRCAESCRAMAE